MDKDRIWQLVARKVSGEASGPELEELQTLLRANPELVFAVEAFYKMWEARPSRDVSMTDVKRLLGRVKVNESAGKEALVPTAIQKSTLNEFFMFRNYFRTSWRNLVRSKTFSLINITGLAIGMAAAILVMVWISHQLSFDMFHAKKDRIYKLYNLAEIDGERMAWDGTSSLLGPVIQENYPQAEEVFRTNWVSNLIFTKGEKHLEAQGLFTDPGFLRSLDFPLLKGNKNVALDRPESVVLTKSFADRLFDDQDPLGQAIKIDSNANFVVTAILEDPPANTTFQFEYLIPMTYRKQINWEIPKWNDYGVETYVMLKPGVTESVANTLFRDVIRKHAPEMKNELFVHPMSKWYLYSAFENGKATGGQIKRIRMFGIIGGIILLIACFNYMNLSTARSEKRAREVGIRKVVGARKQSLVWQFICESLLIATISGCFALLLAELNIGWFGELVYADLQIPYSSPAFWAYGMIFVIITGVIAGSYPALYLAAQRPIRVLKGVFKSNATLIAPRKVLVVIQFSFAIVFIVCTIVIYRQIRFGQQRETGVERKGLVYAYLRGNLNNRYEPLRNDLYNSGAITSFTRTNSPVSLIWTADASFEWPGKDPQIKTPIATFHSDNDFARTMGIKIIAGRDINAIEYPTDSMAVLLNESAVRFMKLEQPVGQLLKSSQGNWKVVGVIRDFMTGSPYVPPQPVIVQGPRNWFGTISFRLNPANSESENLAKIESIIKKYNPDYPSAIIFADEDFARVFTSELYAAKLAALFAGLAIFITCLGLYALASYMAANRIKEIGVRKVLGASVMSIMALLSKDFLKLVMISFLIAFPVAWWMMHSWLENYPMRTSLSIWIFLITGVLALFIALVTIGYQAVRAAIANPVRSLRTE